MMFQVIMYAFSMAAMLPLFAMDQLQKKNSTHLNSSIFKVIELSDATHITCVTPDRIIINSCISYNAGETFTTLYPIKIFDLKHNKLQDLPISGCPADQELSVLGTNEEKTRIGLYSIPGSDGGNLRTLVLYDAIKDKTFVSKVGNEIVRGVFLNYTQKPQHLLGYDHWTGKRHIVDYEQGLTTEEKHPMDKNDKIEKYFSHKSFLFTRTEEDICNVYLSNKKRVEWCAALKPIKGAQIWVDTASNELFTILCEYNSDGDDPRWGYQIIDNKTKKNISLNDAKIFAHAIAIHPFSHYVVTLSGEYSNEIQFWNPKTGECINSLLLKENNKRVPHFAFDLDKLLSFSADGNLLAVALPSRCVVLSDVSRELVKD